MIVNQKLDILYILAIYVLVFINKFQFSYIFSVYICIYRKSSRLSSAACLLQSSGTTGTGTALILIVQRLAGYGSVGKQIPFSGKHNTG